ncbi:MAG: ribonucleoside triphosphate reductase, partial [Spirochaetia bacterium]|nr:ribonucleoside triphosphate reductase [Spirochaetia bacterium]
SFENHFSTIGLVGMNEAALNAKFLGKHLGTKEGQDFAKQVLLHMRERLSMYQQMYGDLYNLEATPAESTTYRFAKHDKEDFPLIKTAADPDRAPFYTNSSHLPVGYTSDIFEALDIQDQLQTLYTSGTVFHAFLGERMPSWQSAASLVRKIAENYTLPYYTLSPTYSVCSEHGYIPGEVNRCPYCNRLTEIYSRITGYYRPVRNWNDGKAEEFKKRKLYTVSEGSALLFTTKTCPNCKLAKRFLDEANIAYRVIDAELETELAISYEVMQAPTLIIPGPEIKRFANASSIKAYCEKAV